VALQVERRVGEQVAEQRPVGQGLRDFVQVTSIGGRGTAPATSAYQSAKFATEGFSGVLNDEVGHLGIKVTMAEPGLMRTDWSGPSMVMRPHHERYEPVIAPLFAHLRGRRGEDAVARIEAGMAAQVAEDRKWAELGRSVDFD